MVKFIITKYTETPDWYSSQRVWFSSNGSGFDSRLRHKRSTVSPCILLYSEVTSEDEFKYYQNNIIITEVQSLILVLGTSENFPSRYPREIANFILNRTSFPCSEYPYQVLVHRGHILDIRGVLKLDVRNTTHTENPTDVHSFDVFVRIATLVPKKVQMFTHSVQHAVNLPPY